MKYALFSFLLVYSPIVLAQTYSDYFGLGHNIGVSVTTSNDQNNTNEGEKTLNGTGFFPDMNGASRFLAQASLGADYEAIDYLSQIGINAWIDEQIIMSGTSYFDMADSILLEQWAILEAEYGPNNYSKDYSYELLEKAFWQKAITENDLLRQRIAFSLVEILVLSHGVAIAPDPFGLSSYLDILHQNAFGNYRDILFEVTMHPSMAIYLTYFGNKKTDLANNIHPDENYSREIMQLFTIGLHELNLDGSLKLDSNGTIIPTYTNGDIKEFAKIFTGLYASDWDTRQYPGLASVPFQIGTDHTQYDLSIPLTMHDSLHESGSKYLLNNFVTPSQQSGMQDINDAIDNLFNHPNVGPFLSSRLIKLLVKSNPTPAYIKRVAMAFNNNGTGIRGDMEAVIRAILTDPEARDCSWITDNTSGKMREPMVRFSHLIRAFNVYNQSNHFWMNEGEEKKLIKQSIMGAPSVFNFFAPSYSPSGIISANNLIAPEFQIVDDNSSVNYINLTEGRLFFLLLNIHPVIPTPNGLPSPQDVATLDLSDEIATFNTSSSVGLMNRLNLILCHGQLSNETKTHIINALDGYAANGEDVETIVKIAIYFTVVSPDYIILK